MNLETIPSGELTVSNQRSISRLVAQAGQMLLAHGAESTLVCDIMRRIGLACGVHEVAVALSQCLGCHDRNGWTLHHHYSKLCRSWHQHARYYANSTHLYHDGARVTRCCHGAEKLNTISPERYNRWLVVLMIGLSCAAFSHLAGGDWGVFIMTFFGWWWHDRAPRDWPSSLQSIT